MEHLNGNRTGGFKHYNPKRWHPEFDLIVIKSVGGLSNEEIGREFGYTKQHVSNILSTPQAAEVRDRIREEINKNYQGKLKERVSAIGEGVVRHVEKFITDANNLAERSPFDFIDRALKIGTVIGAMGEKVSNISNNGTQNNIVNNGNMILVTGEKANDLKNALVNSMELEEVEIETVK